MTRGGVGARAGTSAPRRAVGRGSIRRAAVSILASAALLFVSHVALADKVAVLPFSSENSAVAKDQLEAARAATKSAVGTGGNTLPSDSEMLTAEMAVKDGVPDSSDEYRAAGRASSSQWTVTGRVEPRLSGHYRLELEVCQIESGRVESLAREIDPAVAPQQIGEMLALLLRPEGIGTSPIPWEHAAPVPVTPPPTPAAPPPTPPPVGQPNPLLPKPTPPPPWRYGADHPIAVGAAVEVLAALDRPSNAQGSSVSLTLGGAFGYALAAVPGLELRADVAGAVAGPQALFLDAGARYAFVLVPSARLYAGPELGLGALVTLGADKAARFLGRGGAVIGVAITPQVQVEAVGDFDWSPGGAGALLLGGGGARALVRF